MTSNFDSARFWESRYRSGGNSGSGSFGRLAKFKASFLNSFVSINNILDVVEFGCGNGAQCSMFNFPKYIGIDVSEKAISDARLAFAHNQGFSFLLSSDKAEAFECDLSLSLDVIFHLIEESVFEKYLRDLFLFSKRFVIIYSSDVDENWSAEHVRHRNFSKAISERYPEWRRVAIVPNIYPFDSQQQEQTSFSDFHIFSCLDEPCRLYVPSRADLE
jgi:hypothetical protein